MSNRNILILFLIGMVLTVAGAFLKIERRDSASFFLIIGMTFEAFSLILLIVKMLTKKDNSDGFLDS